MLPGLSHSSQDGHLVVDMANPLLRVVLPVPDFSWGFVVQLCERAMNCKGLYSVLEQDVEHVATVFAALESSARIDLPDSDPRSPLLSGDSCASDSNSETSPLPAFVPKIIITPPSLGLPPSTSSLIPYQDSAFHTLLTVPTATHTPFNQSYPPMLLPPPPRRLAAPVPACWTWTNGHWQAALIAGTEPRLRKLKRSRKSRMPPVQRSG